jgi:AmmeMemoRadiSam system protein A
MRLSDASRAALLNLARAALLERLATARSDAQPTPAEIAEDQSELLQPAGCFVSLHERDTHRLRGCVGRVNPQQPLWEAVRLTAGEVLEDPRFPDERVTRADVANLSIEVSVLSQPRLANAVEEFDPLNHGVYLIYGGRAGFFLPQVARETGWDREQLLGRLCTEKMGLPPDAWKQPEVKMWLFDVEVVGPEAV